MTNEQIYALLDSQDDPLMWAIEQYVKLRNEEEAK